MNSWFYVDGLDVLGHGARGAVVTLGDSITDSYGSTEGANHRRPDFLTDRLRYQTPRGRLGVLNAGISGNRILFDNQPGYSFGPNAVSRTDRDVPARSGTRTVVLFEGINDIQQRQHQDDPNRIIAGMRRIVRKAHGAGTRVGGGTITPFEGWSSYTPKPAATRQAVNEWIRTGDAFDAVVDFDAAMRDPSDRNLGETGVPTTSWYPPRAGTLPRKITISPLRTTYTTRGVEMTSRNFESL
ncbi:GDSL-type esterase/lipase family protein [Actinopolyspora alba]|uniref:GDSL-type esterase/lipase family protein n=1 Tax=Actinopolyspora alba TaxID=673379 RepID=UPI001C316A01|nr:GDSL-type esterase/lipase family protein [Actinopolyspora alba]